MAFILFVPRPPFVDVDVVGPTPVVVAFLVVDADADADADDTVEDPAAIDEFKKEAAEFAVVVEVADGKNCPTGGVCHCPFLA